LKASKTYLAVFIVFVIIIYSSLSYINLIENKKNALQKQDYKSQAIDMDSRVAEMILSKQKATIAMALSLANNDHLRKDILNNNISKEYYKDLIAKFKVNTQYKNIWIHIVDKNLTSLCRSWTDRRGDNIAHIRKDLVEVIKTKKVTHTISSGVFTIAIKAIVPILKDGEVVGTLELISHFNSISKQMKKFDVDSVVVLDKKFKEKLTDPFTNIFIDDYYVANFDAPLHLRNYMQKKGVENFLSSSYIIDNGYMILSRELKAFDGEILGYYVMFKHVDDISSVYLDFFMFKWLTFGLLFFMVIAGVINIIMFYKMRKQKVYYKNIMDTTTNIVIINDKKNILNVNKVFFKYFERYKSIEEFKKENDCICNFFVEEKGYIQKEFNGTHWVDYLIENNSKNHKVKINIFSKEYYFSLSASMISKELKHYSIVFTDITEQENNRHKLEQMSITDSLTGIGNRRYYHKKILSETIRATRYKHSLSLVMFDIDFFKQVNDNHGHAVGDEVLIEYSKLILSLLRKGDIFCRIGGEEFMVILPHATKDEAKKLAEKLRDKVESYKKVIPITMSFGVVEYIKDEDLDALYKRVDDNLYKAKNSGRNIVVAG